MSLKTENMVDEETKSNTKKKQDLSLTDITFWINRLNLDTSIVYLIMIPLFILNLSIEFYLIGMAYIEDGTILRFFIYVFLFFYASFLCRKIPPKFENLVNNSESIFMDGIKDDKQEPTDTTYEKYKTNVREIFEWKIEFWVGLIIGLIFFFADLYYFGFRTNFEYRMIAGEKIYYAPDNIIFSVIWVIDTALLFFFIAVVTVSALFLIIATFMCISKLGAEYKLDVSYRDLKIRAFDDIGKFIISLTIPTIFFFTSFSIIGLIQVYIYREVFVGFTLVIIGSIGILLLTLLLYKNTIDIHKAIVLYKKELLNKSINHIQDILDLPEDQINYTKIQKIHQFYKRVDDINDWPFNPTSIKKLGITLATSVLPLVLSLFGIF